MTTAYYASKRAERAGGFDYSLQRRSQQVIKMLRLADVVNGRVLDIGTADGKMAPVLEAEFGFRLFVGLEYDREFLARSESSDRRVFVCGDGRVLPFSDAAFDAAVASACVKHVTGADQLLLEVNRVLKPGGAFVICDPTPLAIRLGVRFGRFDPRWLPNIWSLRDWRRVVEDAGFRWIRGERYMLAPWRARVAELAEAVLKPTPLSRLFLHQAALTQKI